MAFLITDLTNRKYGKKNAKEIVYIGFAVGVFLTLFFSTNYSDLISIRIAIGSGIAFLIAQLIDVNIFDKLRNKIWYAAPLTSSLTEILGHLQTPRPIGKYFAGVRQENSCHNCNLKRHRFF